MPVCGKEKGQQSCDRCYAAVGDDLAGPPGGLMGCGPVDAWFFIFFPGSGGSSKEEEQGQEREALKAVAHIYGACAEGPGDGSRWRQFSPVRACRSRGDDKEKDGEIQVMHVCG